MSSVERLAIQFTEAGSRLYVAGAATESAEAFGRARQLAETLGDPSAENGARFWEGCALHGAGRLREALAAMAPPLARGGFSLGDPESYRLVTRYVRVLVELPAQRRILEPLMADVEQRISAEGEPGWRSRMLIVRARLALSTGHWRHAVDLGRQALEARKGDPWGCTYSSYYWVCTQAAIWVGELDRANELLDEWRRVDGHLPSQRIFRPALRSCALRRAGRAPDALEYARAAFGGALAQGDYPPRMTAASELTRVLLTLGEVESAREPLRQVLRYRRSEVAEHAFAARMLLADHRLAEARALAGLPARDAEFHHHYAPVRSGRHRRKRQAVETLALASRAYSRLVGRARVLDDRLENALRAWQLADRRKAARAAGAEIDR